MKKRIGIFCKNLNIVEIENYLHGFQHICAGNEESGTIGKLPAASRFRWLTATRSSILQTSPVHQGFCDDPLETIEKLFNQLVKLDE